MIKYIKQYFIFTKRERIGTYILLLIIIAILIIRFSISHKKIDQTIALEKFKKEIAEFEKAQELNMETNTFSQKIIDNNLISSTTDITYFSFNPNTLTVTEWKKLGLSDNQISVIHNYLNKGGQFRTKNDLKKIYSISDQKYTELEPFIELPDKRITSSSGDAKWINGDSIIDKKSSYDVSGKNFPIELNVTSKYDLTVKLNLKPELAEEIVKYRNYLKGFYSTSQLIEIESMDSITYNNIKDLIKVNPNYIRKININTDSSRDLWHPYISKSLQKNMFNYRQVHGDYKQIEDIKNLALINDEIYRKLVYYLTTE